jgi:hypothetical protein
LGLETAVKINGDDVVPLNAFQKQRLIDIDMQVKQIIHDGGDKALLLSLYDFMEDFKKIMDACSNKELDGYCKEYDGFYYLAKILEDMARGIADGTIPALG